MKMFYQTIRQDTRTVLSGISCSASSGIQQPGSLTNLKVITAVSLSFCIASPKRLHLEERFQKAKFMITQLNRPVELNRSLNALKQEIEKLKL